mmetsp:Transcript_50162/g.89566  ORF Transcript_50162/g.89566 Transcript_50162/m.89566 type:complete len:85 (+) Transcript_50162:311-565(+)
MQHVGLQAYPKKGVGTCNKSNGKGCVVSKSNKGCMYTSITITVTAIILTPLILDQLLLPRKNRPPTVHHCSMLHPAIGTPFQMH